MNTIVALSVLLLVGLAARPSDGKTLNLNESIYLDDFVVYTGKNEITKIVVPLNSINFDENTDFEDKNFDIYVFFVEEKSGLYVLKDGVATKLLDNGNDAASSMDDSKKVFLGATDGIYTFNAETKTAEKYGTLTDNIRNIVVTNGTDEIYILTEDKRFYKVIDEGTKKEEIVDVKDALQVVLDNSNNLFFVDNNKQVYVRSFEDGIVQKVKGLPANPKSALLVRPPAVVDVSAACVSGKKVYEVRADGTSQLVASIPMNAPTAYSVETSLIIYYGYNKKIYQYSLLDRHNVMSSQKSMEHVKSYLNNKAPNFKEVAKKKTLRQ